MVEHVFGGDWTEQKLIALKLYLNAYRLIFTKNAKASYFKTIYFDAFAGNGNRVDSKSKADQLTLFETEDEATLARYKAGSARIALGLDSPFDKYIFVDNNQNYVDELKEVIRIEFPHLEKRCHVWKGDGCEILRQQCVYGLDRNKDRAVVFLDPYGISHVCSDAPTGKISTPPSRKMICSARITS